MIGIAGHVPGGTLQLRGGEMRTLESKEERVGFSPGSQKEENKCGQHPGTLQVHHF